jgi:hypothetical protein
MTHCQALAAVAGKIIHTVVYLCLTSFVGVCICFDTLLNSVFFLYESYVKYDSARKCRRKFRYKFLGITAGFKISSRW